MGDLLSAEKTSGEKDTAMKAMLVIESLSQAFGVLGETGLVVRSGRGNIGKLVVRCFKGILEGRMKSYIDRRLEEIRSCGGCGSSQWDFFQALIDGVRGH
jgi:hypothetical protein